MHSVMPSAGHYWEVQSAIKKINTLPPRGTALGLTHWISIVRFVLKLPPKKFSTAHLMLEGKSRTKLNIRNI